MPATPWPRLCSPRATAWSHVPSNTTARGASWARGSKSATRSWAWASVRSTNPTCPRPWSRRTRACRSSPKTLGPRCIGTGAPSTVGSRPCSARAFITRPSWGRSKARGLGCFLKSTSAAPPASAAPTNRPTNSATTPNTTTWTCWSWAVAPRVCAPRCRRPHRDWTSCWWSKTATSAARSCCKPPAALGTSGAWPPWRSCAPRLACRCSTAAPHLVCTTATPWVWSNSPPPVATTPLLASPNSACARCVLAPSSWPVAPLSAPWCSRATTCPVSCWPAPWVTTCNATRCSAVNTPSSR